MEGRAQTLELDSKNISLKPGLASKDYSKAKLDYQDAKAVLDGWIVKLQTAIMTGDRVDDSMTVIKAWAEQSQAFMDAADAYDRKARGLKPILKATLPDEIISLIPGLIEEYVKLQDAQKGEMTKFVGNLKCKPWPG